MRRTIAIVAIACMVLLSGCRSENCAIESAAQAYLDAVADYDFDKAAQYATDETQQVTLQFFKDVLLPNTDPHFIEQNRQAQTRITAIDLLSDSTAEVRFVKSTPLSTDSSSLPMLKRDGQWKAHVVIVVPSYFRQQRRDIPAEDLHLME